VKRKEFALNKLMVPRRRALLLSGAALAAPMIASDGARAADDWPTKPVRYINLFPAGGPTDVLSRIACQKLTELTGQQFIVENKGGSGGNVGAEAIKNAAPDGYTIGLMSVSSHAIAPSLYARLPFDADKDFTPVTMLWSLPNLLIVRKSLGARTVTELIAMAREKPGKLSYASSGAGTTVHLSGALFCSMAKIDILHVPYRGSAPAVQDLLADQVDMIFDNIPGSLAQMAGGKVNGLAVTSLQRSPIAPNVPAMAEFLPGYDINSWGGICGPAGLPPAMVEKLNALAAQALDSDDVKKAYLKNGATPLWMNVADTVAYRRAEEKRFGPIVKASGARVE
jgi:tripartite-type tricarboxylate transporter receptor subunit TctC